MGEGVVASLELRVPGKTGQRGMVQRGQMRKAWSFVYAVIAGLCIAFLIGAGSFFVAIAISWLSQALRWHLGEYQMWLPIIGLEYGFLLGLIPAVIIARRFYRSRTRGAPTRETKV